MVHTPAPWNFATGGAATRYIIRSKDGENLFMSYGQDSQEQDAALIAAAPELLHHLIVMTDHVELTVEGMDDWVSNRIREKMNAARAAIAKAGGAA